MLRQVLIYQQVRRLFFAQFGKVTGEEVFDNVLKTLQKDALNKSCDPGEVRSCDFFKYRVSYLAAPDKDLLFLLVTDLTDTAANVKEQLLECKNQFFAMFGEVLDQQFDPEAFELFQSAAEKIHKALRPKISLVGYSGVGKTTITKLIKAEEIPVEHVPTITGDIGTIQIGKLSFSLWDFAGQEQFDFLWNKFVQGSDAVLVITDSTIENLDKSRYFLDLAKEEAPHAHVAVIANKQDLPGALPVTEVEQVMAGTHAYGMVAVDPANREKMIALVADILEMSAEVSPLLKPLTDRDRKVSEAEQALLASDFLRARQLFTELSDLSLELGDDSRAAEFRANAERVAQALAQPGQVPKPACFAPGVDAGSASQTQSPPAASMRLRVDLANTEKFLVDLEVKNITGQLSDEEFQQKKTRLEQVRGAIEKQIADNEELAENLN